MIEEVYLIHDGYFELDGGMLYYGVPKYFGEKIWGRLNSLLVKTEGGWVLVDSGMGSLPERVKRYYPRRDEGRLIQFLEEMGVKREEVWGVVQTHLHLDHAGWASSFPNARIYAQVEEIRYSFYPDKFQKGAYLPEQLQGLKFHPLYGEEEVVPGLRVIPTPGHTPGHQSVVVEKGGRRVVFTGDVTPTSLNMEKEWIVGVLYSPVEELKSLMRLKRMMGEGVTFIYSHGEEVQPGRIL